MCIFKRKQLIKADLQMMQLLEVGDRDFKTIYGVECEGLGISGE